MDGEFVVLEFWNFFFCFAFIFVIALVSCHLLLVATYYQNSFIFVLDKRIITISFYDILPLRFINHFNDLLIYYKLLLFLVFVTFLYIFFGNSKFIFEILHSTGSQGYRYNTTILHDIYQHRHSLISPSSINPLNNHSMH